MSPAGSDLHDITPAKNADRAADLGNVWLYGTGATTARLGSGGPSGTPI
jgi:hypothetical protein